LTTKNLALSYPIRYIDRSLFNWRQPRFSCLLGGT